MLPKPCNIAVWTAIIGTEAPDDICNRTLILCSTRLFVQPPQRADRDRERFGFPFRLCRVQREYDLRLAGAAGKARSFSSAVFTRRLKAPGRSAGNGPTLPT